MTVILSHIRDVPCAPVDYVPGLTPSANNAVLRALSKKPEDRFVSCAEFVAAMEYNAAVEKAVSPVPLGAARRTPAHLAPLVIGGAFILGAGLIGFGLVRSNNQKPVPSLGAPPPLAMPTPPALSASAAEDYTHTQPKKIIVTIPSTQVPKVDEQDRKSVV